MKIGFTELILVAIVAFVVIGPDKLPEYARKLGKMLRELKKYTGAASEEIQKNVVEPLNEIQAPIKEAVAPLTDIKKDIDDSMKDVTKSFTNIGKTSKEEAKKAEEVEEVAELEDTVEELPEEPVKAEEPAAEPVKAEEKAEEPAAEEKPEEAPAANEAPAEAAPAAILMMTRERCISNRISTVCTAEWHLFFCFCRMMSSLLKTDRLLYRIITATIRDVSHSRSHIFRTSATKSLVW